MRTRGLLAVVGVVALLAGCGTVSAGGPDGIAARVVAGARETPQQRAAADAADLLASFIPPPHAVRLTRSPVSLLGRAPSEPLSANVVLRSGWWRVAGQPQGVLAWIKAHQPAGSSDSGGGGIGAVPPRGAPPLIPPLPGPQVSFIDFSLPDVPGVLVSRSVIAAVAADGRDQTVIGVYGESSWLPARTAAELIPAVARLVTITPLPGHAPPARTDHQVTITDPAQVARIAAVVNALPSQPPVGWMECGPFPGPGMQLTFRASAAGPALAVVTAHQELCPVVSLVIGGRQMPPLDGAETLFSRVMAIAGFHWTDFPAPGPTAPGPVAPGPIATTP
jgi:hypothetical protein